VSAVPTLQQENESPMTQSITLRSCLSGSGLSYLRDVIKLEWRAALHRRQTRHWLHLLNSSPALRDLVRSHPRLIHKIYRPYLSNTMNCQGRLAALTEHYRFIARHDLSDIVARAARAPVVLADIAGKSGVVYHVQLRAINAMEREGELILQLTCGPALIYSVAFSFMTAEHRMCVGVGCMQGPQGADGLSLVREATRDLHGLRPKNLMLRLARQLGHDYDCQALVLVGNDNRAVRQSAKKGLLFADYDTLWLEMGAHARGNGDFELACEDLPAPVMEEIASKKRSEARKRHETLQAIIHAIRLGLNAAGASVPAAANDAAAPATAPDLERDFATATA